MDTGFLRVLLNPGRFFEARMQDEPSLKVPALIALVIGLVVVVLVALGIAGAIYYSWKRT